MRRFFAACVAVLLLVPAVASADPFDEVFADYQTDQRIDPCAHTEAELQQAKGDIPNDIDQYAPDFPAALDEAMEQRARSGCEEGSSTTATSPDGAEAAPPGSGGTAAPGTPGAASEPNPPGQTPGPPGTAQPADAAKDGAIVNAATQTDDRGGDLPAPLVALAILALLLAVCLLVWGLFRYFAWDPRWLAGARHSVAEAGWRTSGAWADFTDWLKTRRRPA